MIAKVEALAAQLEKAISDFCDIAVVGISGGVDSAVVASICVAALGPEKVYLVSMPYDETDEVTFNARSAELAESLKAQHLVVHIGGATDAVISELSSAFQRSSDHKGDFHRLTGGNTRSRMRMTVLYGIAGELSYRAEENAFPAEVPGTVRGAPIHSRVRVIGTGNASEDLIGYDTKGGDALADIFVIGDLFKSEVYQLAQHYQVPRSIIEAPPSAGLYEGQTDVKELGHSYDELEPALSALHRALARGVHDSELNENLEEFRDVEAKHASFVIRRFLANAHKHRAPLVVQVRNTELIRDLWSQ